MKIGRAREAKPLDPRESRFADEYLVDLDPQRAAVEAGYSKSLARTKAYQWVSNREMKPHLFDEIRRRQAKRQHRTEVRGDRVLLELARLGFSDIRQLFNADGTAKAVHELDDETAAAVAGIEAVVRRSPNGGTETSVKYRFWDKPSALEKLARHLDILAADVLKVVGADGGPIKHEHAVDLRNLPEDVLAKLAAVAEAIGERDRS